MTEQPLKELAEMYKVYTLGKTSERHMGGRVTLAGILTNEEYSQIEKGLLVPINKTGGIMSLDAPLHADQEVWLKKPSVDMFAGWQIPINDQGEYASVKEASQIQQYELFTQTSTRKLSLAEIRKLMIENSQFQMQVQTSQV
jgi:hypothetical protein